MLEKIIIIGIIILAIAFISRRVTRTLKGTDTCSGCASNCNSCGMNIPSSIKEENEIE
ncbi:MAG: FeoB-associated Cys-rich membrane protein [Syntrophomonadaceae bacterium]|nr:FeoB-associated Cys-rich membrane protein [Syntrophomonadaceae bacterium]